MMQHATMTVPSSAQKNNNHIQPTLPPCGPPTAISSSCSQSMTESSMALHSPSTTGHPHGVNAISVSYGSISIPSNFHQSQTSTPTGGVAPVIPAQSANADCVETLSDPISNLRIAPTMPVTCTKSNPVTPSHSYSFSVSKKTTSKKAFKKRKRSAAEKFGDEFWNKAKVREIVRGNGIIGHFEAKAMLANFRNVDVDQIDSTDVALRYIESKTVRRLKRSLKDMDYTIRKVLYYGSDFRHLHEQCMLGHTNDDDIFAVALNTQQNANVLNLGDLSNHISTSLDDYFQSPHTVVTPKDAPQSNMPQLNLFAAAADTAADMDMDVDVDVDTSNFDPLKGAQNVVMKSKVKFMNMKSPPMKGMAVEGQKMSPWKKRGSTTKQFGKYFDKRGSNVSHGSIWSESSDDDNHDDDDLEMDMDADSDDDAFVLAQYNGHQDGDAPPDLIDFPSHDDDEDEDDEEHQKRRQQSLDVPTNASSNANTKVHGHGHLSHLSFASSVSLGSDYGATSAAFGAIQENAEVVMDGGDPASLKRDRSTSSRKSKKLKQRKYTKDGQEIAAQIQQQHTTAADETPIKLLKIDSLLLEPDHGSQAKHDAHYSLDSLLSDMELPEPTPVQKLKYHLTEPRLPPTRRRTYG